MIFINHKTPFLKGEGEAFYNFYIFDLINFLKQLLEHNCWKELNWERSVHLFVKRRYEFLKITKLDLTT